MQQSPVSGWRVNAAREVRVTVSSGLVVPDVVGQTRSEAELNLARFNWTPVSIDSAPDARVRLQYPPPGVPVDAPGQMSLAYEEQTPQLLTEVTSSPPSAAAPLFDGIMKIAVQASCRAAQPNLALRAARLVFAKLDGWPRPR